MITTFKLTRQAYLAALGRKPTDAEMGAMRAALNMAYVANDLLAEAETWFTNLFFGAEYVARGRTNTEFIQDAHIALYDHVGDPVSMAGWVATLVGGATRASVFADLIAWHEFPDRIDVTVPVDDFPTPDQGGPIVARRFEPPPEYDEITNLHEYEDKGISTNTVTTVAPRVFELEYALLSLEDAFMLDDHYDAAMGQNWSFSYTERNGTVHTGVRYQKNGYDRRHKDRYQLQDVKVKLIKRPN